MRTLYLKDNRLGIVQIATSIMEEWPDQVRQVMAQLVIVRCEHFYAAQHFEYTAYSPHFDPISEGDIIPHYVAIFEHRDVTPIDAGRLAPKRYIHQFKEFSRWRPRSAVTL